MKTESEQVCLCHLSLRTHWVICGELLELFSLLDAVVQRIGGENSFHLCGCDHSFDEEQPGRSLAICKRMLRTRYYDIELGRHPCVLVPNLTVPDTVLAWEVIFEESPERKLRCRSLVGGVSKLRARFLERGTQHRFPCSQPGSKCVWFLVGIDRHTPRVTKVRPRVRILAPKHPCETTAPGRTHDLCRAKIGRHRGAVALAASRRAHAEPQRADDVLFCKHACPRVRPAPSVARR